MTPQSPVTVQGLSNYSIADVVDWSTRTVSRARANIQAFGTVRAPKNTGGRRSSIPDHVLTALLDRLLIKPDLYLDEMSDYISDEYELEVSEDSIRRSLKKCKWTRKKTRQVAKKRCSELRDACLHELSEYTSWQLAFVDEFRCETRHGIQRTGLAPRGVTSGSGTSCNHKQSLEERGEQDLNDAVLHLHSLLQSAGLS